MAIGQLDSQDSLAKHIAADAVDADWQHAARNAQVPQRTPTRKSALRTSSDTSLVKSRRSWWESGLGLLRNACLGIAIISAAPFAVIAVRGDVMWFNRGDLQERITEAENMRAFAAPVNPAVTVARAGAAFHALNAPRQSAEFPTLPRLAPPHRAWRASSRARAPTGEIGYPPLPDPADLLLRAHRGLGRAELSQLRSIAESPLWSAVDIVASASRIDFIGSQFVVPFTANAWAPSMPIHSMQGTREIAEAGIARAAYHVALGDYDRAEQSLRSIVSYGFAFIDNGSTAIDGLLGRVIVGIARDGLAQLAQIRGDASTMSVLPELKTWRVSRTLSSAPPPSPAETRAQQFRDAADESLPRPLRYESLSRLAFGSCGDVRFVLTGTSPEVRAAFDDARSTLARSPAEQAYLDLIYRTPASFPADAIAERGFSRRLLLGAATVAATALQNPRIVACTRMVMNFKRDER